MNSFPLTLPQGNLPPINLTDVVVQLMMQGVKEMMRGGVSEVEMLKDCIVQGKVADLAEHLPTKLGEVAQLCLDMVGRHPKEVTVLLWNGGVAAEAMKLMREMAQSDAPDAQKKALALAQAILDAGHEMDVDSTAWPAGVSELLQERQKARQDYAAHQVAKFDGVSLKGGLEVFRSAEVPFLSKRTGKSTDNFCNGVLDESGKPLARRHLLEAVKDDRKKFLEQVNLRKVSFGYEAIEKRCVDAKRLRGELAVQCAPDSFGQLLAHMASRIPPGKSETFDLSFSLAGDFGNVRDMVVFLEKTSEKGAMALKVSLYDPEVTGDMSHLRVLPEELAKLSFHDFDLRRAFKPGSVELLNLMQDDWDLAISLRGRYIPRHSKVQVESLLNALAYGNLYGLQHAIVELGTLHGVGVPIDDLNDRSKDLALAFRQAMVGRHVKVLKELLDSPLMLGSLTPKTLEEMVWAKDRLGVSGLPGAINARSVVEIEALGTFLLQVKGKLNLNVVKEVTIGPDVLQALANEPRQNFDDVITAYGGVLRQLRDFLGIRDVRDVLLTLNVRQKKFLLDALELPSNEIDMLLQPDFDDLLPMAIQSGDTKTITAYFELVTVVQESDSYLEQEGILGVAKKINSICYKRLPWYYCCAQVLTPEFKRLVQLDPGLGFMFWLATDFLKP